MDKKLRLLLHLFGDLDDSEELEALLRDDELRYEYEQFAEVKHLLERLQVHNREAVQPDSGVVSTIMQAAAARRPIRLRLSRRRNRKPHVARVYRIAGWSSVALAAVIAGILVWPAEVRKLPLLPETAVAPEMEQAVEVPAWDDGSLLIDVNDHIEVLSARSAGESWDEPQVLRIDSLPAVTPSSGFTPASISR